MDFFQITGAKKSGFSFSATVILFVILSLIIQGLFGVILPTDGVWYKVVCAFCSPLAICLVVLFSSLNKKVSVLSVCSVQKFNPLYIIPAVLLSVGMLFGLGFINDLVSSVFVNAGLNVPTATVPFQGVWSLVVYLISLALLPALFEESLFRGLMLGGFERKNGFLSIFSIAVCFALYHGSVSQFAYQLIYGVWLTALAYKSGSSLPSMITHFINNALVLILSYLGVAVDFYNPVLITVGVILLLGVTAFLIFYDCKTERENSQEPQYKTALGFWAYALMGVAVTVAIIVGNLMV